MNIEEVQRRLWEQSHDHKQHRDSGTPLFPTNPYALRIRNLMDLMHHPHWLRVAAERVMRRSRNKAPGVDGVTPRIFSKGYEEKIEAHGTDVKFYHQDIEGSERDPLYDEPVDREFRGPFKLKAFVEYIPGQPEMTENGMRVTWAGTLYVARATLDNRGIPTPLEGDVFQFWDEIAFFKEHLS